MTEAEHNAENRKGRGEGGGGDSSFAKVRGLTRTLCSTMQTIVCTGCALDYDIKRHNMQPVGQRSGEMS